MKINGKEIDANDPRIKGDTIFLNENDVIESVLSDDAIAYTCRDSGYYKFSNCYPSKLEAAKAKAQEIEILTQKIDDLRTELQTTRKEILDLIAEVYEDHTKR